MPWKTSIDPSFELPLPYMKFWEWQLTYMQQHLTNLRVIPLSDDERDTDLSYLHNAQKPARLYTMCFTCEEYSKIRMTVYDAGHATQVFNTLWYPRAHANDPPYGPLPVFGVDLLQFHNTKHLCVMDFQPLINEPHPEYAPASSLTWWQEYQETMLKPIRNAFPVLQGKMSKRFYDEHQFFSQQMLFGRFDKQHHLIDEQVYPAFQQFVQQHVRLVQTARATQRQEVSAASHSATTTTTSAPASSSASHEAYLSWHRQQQAAYDTYSAQRDPAHGLLSNTFGKDVADRFVYNVLFSMSQRPQPEQDESQPHEQQ
jgi:15,16-dihydrobiliverdin:ferredoxin oxidoreductase